VTLSSAVLALVRHDLDKVAPAPPFGLSPRCRWFHPGKQGIRLGVDRKRPGSDKEKRGNGPLVRALTFEAKHRASRSHGETQEDGEGTSSVSFISASRRPHLVADPSAATMSTVAGAA
jgi:hypothetical protein